MQQRSGFTQIEVLITATIVGVLAAVAVPVVGHFQDEGYKAKEIASARKLIAGYQVYTAENDGDLMPGYVDEYAEDAEGNSIGFPANARYPWRLAPYVDFDISAFYTGRNTISSGAPTSHYGVSVAPNLGMNVTFVGGDYGSSSDLVPSEKAFERYGQFCATRISHVSQPSKLIVFVSARRSKKDLGNYKVQSPYLTGSRWSGKFSKDAPASDFGFVDLRFGGKAVAAMLDGHVKLMNEDEVKDMRHWSIQAADADDPNYTLRRQ